MHKSPNKPPDPLRNGPARGEANEMETSTRILGVGLVVAIAAMAAVPLVGADASDTAPTVYTSCTGGYRNFQAVAMDEDSRVNGDSSAPDGGYYLDPATRGVWRETNHQEGLQNTARVCSEYDLYTGAFVRSYVLYPADTRVS